MPHDMHGKEVHAGDIVKGKGYNIQHEIIGEVLHVIPNSDACNIQVAVCNVRKNYGHGLIYNDLSGKDVRVLEPGVEYGACKDFEVIQAADEAGR